MIYFIKDTVTQAIKIGYSRSPEKRIGGLQTGNANKLTLLGIVSGTKAVEEQFHLRFGQYRLEGEWFKGDIIEEILAIIEEHKERRRIIRRRTMTEIVSEGDNRAPEPEIEQPGSDEGTLDKDSGIRGVCRIPHLRLGSFTLSLSEREERRFNYEKFQKNGPKKMPDDYAEDPAYNILTGNTICEVEIKYLLVFDKDLTVDEAGQQELFRLQSSIISAGLNKGLWHAFYDEDNAVIPFHPPCSGYHVIGGRDAITGCQGDAFRVLVVFEKALDPKYRTPPLKIPKNLFMGENYTGQHPLKTAKKLVVSLR